MSLTKRARLVVATAIVALVGFSSAPQITSAHHPDGGNSNSGDCYAQITEYKYKRPATKAEYEYVKQVAGRYKHKTGGWHSFDWSIWPGNSTQWSTSNVSVLQSGAHNDTWKVVHDGHEDTYQSQQYRYVPTGDSRQVPNGHEFTGWLTAPPTEDGWVQYQQRTVNGDEVPCDDGETKKVTLCHATSSEDNPYTQITVSVNAFLNSGHIDHDGDIYAAFSYVKHGQTINVPANGDTSLLQYDNCQRPKPTKPTYEPEVVEGYGDCATGDGVISGTRTTTNYKAVFNTTTWQWDKVQNGDPIVETISRPLTEAEQEACRPTRQPTVVREDVGQPECGATTIQVKVTTTTYSYVYDADTTTWTEVAAQPVITYETRDLTADEQSPCAPIEWAAPSSAPECGADNDAVTVPDDTTDVDYQDTGWHGGVRTVTAVWTYDNSTLKVWTFNDTNEACPPAPVPGAEVICVSTGPDYVAWQLGNTGEVAITTPLALAPGEYGVIESLRSTEGTASVEVQFADGSSGTFTGSGDGCTFTPPPTTPPTTPTTPPTTPETTTPPTTPETTTPETTPGAPPVVEIAAVGPVCHREAPYVDVMLGGDAVFNGGAGTITLLDVNGAQVAQHDITFEVGATLRFIYPGAEVDAQGNATDWPGWAFVGGQWVPDNSDALLRDGLTVVLSVNPTDTAAVSYPEATSGCAVPVQVSGAGPETPAAPGTSEMEGMTLPETGSPSTLIAAISAALLLAGAGVLVATRIRKTAA